MLKPKLTLLRINLYRLKHLLSWVIEAVVTYHSLSDACLFVDLCIDPQSLDLMSVEIQALFWSFLQIFLAWKLPQYLIEFDSIMVQPDVMPSCASHRILRIFLCRFQCLPLWFFVMSWTCAIHVSPSLSLGLSLCALNALSSSNCTFS